MKKLFLCFVIAINSFHLFAQGEIKGIVKDVVSGETLIGASVLVKEGKGAVTDIDGKFSIPIEDGNYSVSISYIGYAPQTVSVKVNSKPVILTIALETIELKTVEVVADVARVRQTPVAFSTISPKKITEELGTRDLPMILNSTPGVYATENGGGSGDSRINIRGFDQRNIAVMVDGIPVNDMENGQVFWSNWEGLGDITRSVQVQRGLGASKLAVASVGGTMNMITKGIDQRMQGSVKQEFGSNSLFKTSVAFNTGLLKNGFGITAAVSKKTGEGWVDKTWTEAYSYFFKVQYRTLNHLFSLGVNGAPQKHGQNSTKKTMYEYDASYAKKHGSNNDSLYSNGLKSYGIRYNSNWGRYIDSDGNNHDINERVNYFHKPLFSLSDSWNINKKFYLSNVAYLSIGKGGGTGFPSGTSAPSIDNSGQENFQADYNSNSTTIDKKFDEELTKSSLILRSQVNNHFWYGLLTTANYQLNEKVKITGGIDLRNYTGIHYQEVYDLIGGDYFINTTDKNQPTQSTTAGDPINAYSVKKKGDKIAYNYRSNVKWGGLFGQVEYVASKWSGFITLTGSRTGYKRIDLYRKKDLLIDGNFYSEAVGYGDALYYNGTSAIVAGSTSTVTTSNDTTYITNFNKTSNYIVNAKAYTNESAEARVATTPQRWFSNYTVKGGANYNLDEHNNLYVNLGYLTIAPKFDNVFDRNNNQFYDTKNQIVKAIELGYGLRFSSMTFALNAYRTEWLNKPLDFAATTTIENETVSYQINGINALHKGVEAEVNYNIINEVLKLEIAASMGDWKYTSRDTAYILNDDGSIADLAFFSAVGVHVSNAAQNQFSSSLRYEFIKDLYVKARFTYFGKHYANFDPGKLNGMNADRESWKLPNYSTVDIFAGYEAKGFKNIRYYFTMGVTNLLDTKYVSDGTNINFDPSVSTVFFGLGRRYNASVKISF